MPTFSTEDQTAIQMSDVRCPSCGDSFRVPDFAVPAGAMARCPWCGDSFSMSTLVVHLPPLADLIGEDGEPISMADLAISAAPLALAAAGSTGGSSFGSAAIATPPLLDTDPVLLDAGDLQDLEFGSDDLDADDYDSQQLIKGEVANDIGEFAEDGVTFADAGVPEQTDETTEWNLDSAQQPDSDSDSSENRSDDSDDQAFQNPEVDEEFGNQGGSQPRPLAEVTDFGLGREQRVFASRPRVKKQGSPVKSIIGIAIGGLMAFPLAAGILALAGKPLDLGFWPFDGQTISMSPDTRRSAAPPMEVSPRVANNTDNGKRDGRSLAEDMASMGVDPPSLTDSSGDMESGFDDQPAANDLPDIAPPAAIKLPPMELITPTTAAVEPEMEAEISDSNRSVFAADPVSTAEPVPTADPVVMEVATPLAEPPAVEPIVPSPPVTLPTVSAELQSALEAASSAMGDVVNYDDSEGIKGRRGRLAALFAKVAEVASIASIEDEAAVGSLVERLVDSDIVKDLAPAAPNWARYSGRPNNGMLAAGKLVRENDKWLLQWNNSTPLEVVFVDPSIAEAGSDVIILGTIQQTEPSTVVEVTYLQNQ